MTEFAVCCLVLVPLFLLIPVIAKYAHIKQMGQQAARNAAWSASVAGGHALDSQAAAQRIAVARSFSDARTPITSNVPPAQADAVFGDAMLGTFSGGTLLKQGDLHLTAWDETGSPSLLGSLLSRIPTLSKSFPPNEKGYVDAQIRLDVRDLSDSRGRPMGWLAPFDSLGLKITSRQRMIVDSWNASGSGKLGGNPYPTRTVIAQVDDALVPTAKLKALNKPFAAIGKMPFPVTGQLDKLEFGVIEPDIVPHERLKRYVNPR